MSSSPCLLRRSRRRLLWLLAGFALCQLAVAVAVDCCLPSVRDPEFQDKLERLQARCAEAPGQPLVVVLGSSRTAYGLDAGRLSASSEAGGAVVFNLGIAGGGPLLHRVNLRRLL